MTKPNETESMPDAPAPAPPETLTTLECQCCGDDAASSDANGQFVDGQPLDCGCKGHISVDEDGVGVWISDEPCPEGAKCHG